MRSFSLIVSLLILAEAAQPAESLGRLLGHWVSRDGAARQSLTSDLDGSWVATRMWFKDGESWQLVATGSFYRRPGDDAWHGISRTTDMEGIELFETRLQPISETEFAVSNVSYQRDGSTVLSEETWTFDGDDRYTYTVYFLEDQNRTPMYEGTWLRMSSSESADE
jgi:hypothetical protein